MRVILILITLLLLAITAFAAVPQQISYQGRLTSATNGPITGTRNLTFKVYSSTGLILWSSGPVAVTCTDGLFSINLGECPQPTLPDSVFRDTAATLGITVESDPELTPRTKLTSTAFAYTSLTAQVVLNGPGIAASNSSFDFPDDLIPFDTVAMKDIAVVTITTPADGYIMLTGTCTIYFDGIQGHVYGWIQIDENAGGGVVGPFAQHYGIAVSTNLPVPSQYIPVCVVRVYQKPAGTYTFRLEGMAGDLSQYASTHARWGKLVAQYFPTAYGPVTGFYDWSWKTGSDGKEKELNGVSDVPKKR